MIARLAIRLARSGEASHRYRRAALPVAAAVSVLLLLAGASLVAMALREQQRFAERAGILAQRPAATDVLWLERGDRWRGRQYSVVWIARAGDGQTVLPPGLRRLPRPGGAALSPALARLARDHSALARRYPGHDVIAPAGTRSGDELLAYVRPRRDRSLTRHHAVARLSGFGSTPGPAVSTGIASSADLGAVLTGVVAFLAVPALLLAIAGVVTASHARDRRFAILRALGASSGTVSRLSMLETAALAGAGIVPAAAAWAILDGRIGVVPGVGHVVYDGDLALPAPALAAVAGFALAMCAAIAAVLSRTALARQPRPGSPPGEARSWRAVPLGLAMGAAAGGAVVRSGDVMIAGFVLALLSLPLAGPAVLPALGARLARREPVSALLAGRRLQFDPRGTGRPFGLYGVTVLLGIGTGCYVGLLDAVQPASLPREPVAAAIVRWSDPAPDDIARLRSRLRGTDVLALEEDEHGRPTIGARCVRGLRCDGTDERLAALLGLPPGTPVRFGPPPQRPAAAVVVASGSLHALDERTRSAAQRSLTAWSVASPLDRVTQRSPLDGWLKAALRVAVGALTLAGLLLVIDGVLRARRSNAVLRAIGLSGRQQEQLEATLFALPFWTLAGLSAGTGLVFAGLFASVTEVSLPLGWIGAIASMAFAGGLAGALVVARVTRREEVELTRS